MSTSRDAFSPAESWETQSEDVDDDMDYEVDIPIAIGWPMDI